MWSPVTVSLLLLAITAISAVAEHVNIEVYSHAKGICHWTSVTIPYDAVTDSDDVVIDSILRVAKAFEADNRYVVAILNERDCSGTDPSECSGHNSESVTVTINRYCADFFVLTPSCMAWQLLPLIISTVFGQIKFYSL